MWKIPISGGPHSGKSSLVNALRGIYPDASFLPEPAENIINGELAKQLQDPSYVAVLPNINLNNFNWVVVKRYISQELSVKSRDGIAFQDRSLWDSVVHFKIANAYSDLPEVIKLAKAAHYAFAFFCEPVGQYAQTKVRSETEGEAKLQHEAFRSAYAGSSMEVISLPSVSIEERLAIVHAALESRLDKLDGNRNVEYAQ